MSEIVSGSFEIPIFKHSYEFSAWVADTIDSWLGELYEEYAIFRIDIDRSTRDDLDPDWFDNNIARLVPRDRPKAHIYCRVDKPIKANPSTYSRGSVMWSGTASAPPPDPTDGDLWLSVDPSKGSTVMFSRGGGEWKEVGGVSGVRADLVIVDEIAEF